MRFLVRLESRGEVSIPLDYRRRVISLMKRVFGLREFLENRARPYAVAIYLGKGIDMDGHIIKGVRFINLRVSTGNPVHGMKLYNGLVLLKGKEHTIGEAVFTLKDVRLEQEGDWSKAYFKSLSPVVVERQDIFEWHNPKIRYVLPGEEDFEKSLLEITLKRFEAIQGYNPEVKTFSLEFDYFKEEMVRHYGGYIRSFMGRFRVHTDSQELLRFIYQYGLGLRTGQGFGYLEVV